MEKLIGIIARVLAQISYTSAVMDGGRGRENETLPKAIKRQKS